MKRFVSIRTVLPSIFAGLILVSVGCSSAPDAAPTVDAMGKFGLETAKVKDGIDRALQSLESLVGTQGDDLKTPFQTYKKSIEALDEQATIVRGHAEEMQTQGDEFFKAWEADTSEGGASPERRAELNAAYGKIKDQSVKAKDEFQPFLKSLKDVQSYLSLDLTRQGLASVSDLVGKAKAKGAEVKASIEAVIGQVNSVRGMLSKKPAE